MTMPRPQDDAAAEVEKALLKHYLTSKYGQQQELADAQQQQLDNQAGTSQLHGAQVIAQGLTRGAVAPDESFIKAKREQDLQPVHMVEQKRNAAMQAHDAEQMFKHQGQEDVKYAQEQAKYGKQVDPNSRASINAQYLAKKYGLPSEGASAQDIEPSLALAEKGYSADKAYESHLALADKNKFVESKGMGPEGQPMSLNQATGTWSMGPTASKSGSSSQAGMGDGKTIQHEADQIHNAFVKPGARSEVGQLKTKIDGAESLQNLIAKHPDFVSPAYQTELAMGLAKMLTGGVPNKDEVEKLDPQTIGSWIAKMGQQLTGKPYDAHNPGIVKQFLESIDNQKATAHDQYGRLVSQAMGSTPHLYKQDPKRFHQMTGTKPEDFTTDDQGSTSYIEKASKIGQVPKPGAPVDSGQKSIFRSMSKEQLKAEYDKMKAGQ